MNRWGLALLLFGAPASILVAVACGDPTHVFQGRAWIEARQCLGTTSSVDVVEGSTTRTCNAACLTQPHPDGGRSVYVSSMCAPYPFMFDAAGNDPQCPPALAALVRDDTCQGDGASTNPLPRDAAAE